MSAILVYPRRTLRSSKRASVQVSITREERSSSSSRQDVIVNLGPRELQR